MHAKERRHYHRVERQVPVAYACGAGDLSWARTCGVTGGGLNMRSLDLVRCRRQRPAPPSLNGSRDFKQTLSVLGHRA